MNDGKICVSICAETADELIREIKRAEAWADIIELRFDCLEPEQIQKALALLDSEKTLLLAYRPTEQGGKTDADRLGRIAFWNSFVGRGSLDSQKFWIDCEYDLRSEISNLKFQKIISFHDISGTPKNLSETYENLSGDSNVIKIAVQAGDVADSIPVWKLLEKAKRENKKIVPVAMGAGGVWTRILGLAHGAFMTYAALDEGKETAEGQLTANDLIETYRVRELYVITGIYGVIGGNTSYSLSPFVHNSAFKFNDLDAVYIPFETKDLEKFFKNFLKEARLNFKGFSVTIPHKEAVIEYLDETDETAKAIGAVNTIKIENGKLIGCNTDADGFIEPLKTAFGDLSGAKVAVFGAGGAARACVYALKKENAEVTIVARNLKKAETLANEFEVKFEQIANQKSQIANFEIVVNATPLGTKGALESETILAAPELEGVRLIYDLVYNPRKTRLIREAKKANVPAIGGLEMFVAQAAAQQKIWTGKEAPVEKMRRAALLKLE